jgi:xylose dehydrogenase (NAD/NADP)
MSTSDGRRMRWGILGAARINELVVDGCRDSACLEFVAVASRDERRARRHAEALRIPRHLGSYEQLLEAPDVDAVYVPLPNAAHLEWTMRALEAGKHVLVEKPFSLDPQGVDAAFALAEARGLLLAEAFMYRFHPQTYAVREIIRSGRLGELVFIHADLMFNLGDRPGDFRLSREQDGGALMDVGCYGVNVARLLAGEPEGFEAVASFRGHETDMRFSGSLRFPGGVVATFHSAMDVPLRERLEVIGTRGSLVVEDPWQCRAAEIRVRDGEGEAERVATPKIDRYRAQFEAFSRAAESGAPLEWGREDAVAQATTLRELVDCAQVLG